MKKTKKFIMSSLLLGSMVVLGGCNVLKPEEKTADVVNEPTPSLAPSNVTKSTDPEEVVEVVDEVKDGVYTNYTYGFRFNIDENFFTFIEENGRDFIASNAQDKDDFVNSRNFTILFVDSDRSSETITNQLKKLHSELLSEDYGFSINLGKDKNSLLSQKELENGSILIMYKTETLPETYTEAAWTHSLIFKQNDLIHRIAIVDLNPNNEEVQRSLIQDIFETIELI